MRQPDSPELSQTPAFVRLAVDVAGTVVSMIPGAVAGLLIPLKAEAAVINVVGCALVGCPMSSIGSSCGIVKTSIAEARHPMSRRRLKWSLSGAGTAALLTMIACAVDGLHGRWLFVQQLFFPFAFLGAVVAWWYEGDNSPERLSFFACVFSIAINTSLGAGIGFWLSHRRRATEK